MKSIIQTLHGIEGLLTLGPVDAHEITKAETELAVSFSPEYKDYTQTFGAVSFNGKDFTGVVQPASLSVVEVTRAARKITPAASPEWYVVMDPHFDGIIIWQGKDGMIYQTGPGMQPEKVAETLEEYMRKA